MPAKSPHTPDLLAARKGLAKEMRRYVSPTPHRRPEEACCRCGSETCDVYHRDPVTGKGSVRAWCVACYEQISALAQWAGSAARPGDWALGHSRRLEQRGRYKKAA